MMCCAMYRMKETELMEEQVITITVRTRGEKCRMTDEQIREWYESHVKGLFNAEYGDPKITVEVKRNEE